MTEPEYLTIRPGSVQEQAVDAIVNWELGTGPRPTREQMLALDPQQPGHMVAIGARIDCRRRGKTDPTQLTHDEWHGWYGVTPND